MRIMLTSFGLGHEFLSEVTNIPSAFRRLPPLNMRSSAGPFEPEYSLLVLCDKLILDELSFERLGKSPSPVFATMAKTVRLLYDEGFVELVDYSSVLRDNVDLLHEMTNSDITRGKWGQTLFEAESIWRDYANRVFPGVRRAGFRHGAPEIGHMDVLHITPHSSGVNIGSEISAVSESHRSSERNFIALNSQLADDLSGSTTHGLITAYLTYVNANLILANNTNSALHDWEDFLPFYQHKFLGVGRRNPPGSAQADASRRLFDIVLPELAIDSPQHLLRVLRHRHVEELRALIDAASNGDVEFDANFARNVFREVFGIERKAAKGRRIIGYVTMPIGFIPLIGNFAQALLQETTGTLLERKLRKPYRWLYMLSDLASEPTTQALPKRP